MKLASKKEAEWIYKIISGVFKQAILPAPFFSKKPNSNGVVEDCLAIMTMSAIDLVIETKKQTDTENYEIAAIILRSLLEVNANISYIFRESKKRKLLASRFLKTAELAPKNLFALNNNKKPIKVEWAFSSITRRVEALGRSEILIYKFLSSYTHADAGLMGAYYKRYRQRLGPVFVGFSAISLLNIMYVLAKLDLIDEKHLSMNVYETLKKRLSELK